MTMLRSLDVSNNSLAVALPTLNNMTKMRSLNLMGCQVHGQMPAWLLAKKALSIGDWRVDTCAKTNSIELPHMIDDTAKALLAGVALPDDESLSLLDALRR